MPRERRRGIDVRAIDPSDGRSFDEWFAVLHVTDLERRPQGPGWLRAERLGHGTRPRRARGAPLSCRAAGGPGRRHRRPRDVPPREHARRPRRRACPARAPPQGRGPGPGRGGGADGPSGGTHRARWHGRDPDQARLRGLGRSVRACPGVHRRVAHGPARAEPAARSCARRRAPSPRQGLARRLLAADVRRPVARRVLGRSLRARAPHVDRRAGRGTAARRGGVGRGSA